MTNRIIGNSGSMASSCNVSRESILNTSGSPIGKYIISGSVLMGSDHSG